MLKHCLLGLLLTATTFMSYAEEAKPANSTNANTAYIIDNLYTFMRSGASKNYRLLGSVDAGTKLTLLSAEENGFIKIKDDKDREGWIETKFVTKTAGLHQQYKTLSSEMSTMQENLRQAQIELPQLQEQNQTLTDQNLQLSAQITKLKTTLEQERTQKEAASSKEKRQLLTYGGAIAFLGLFLGIILTIVLSRRKRYEGWA
ncbi:TIGR04211 family SH3 domain-containing protein [Pseudoalteromonas sp. NZS127_1]|uniref:TIGR04211 family SH3 domain-containing protein n=3 Tax=Gammaproteobacteria TaxID=1236 RepID=A0AAP7CKU4_9GAMM|nr:MULTISPECIES: TIGR04211 family SH3 domain-containing protein [Pseudoalteromonas]MBG9995525.1 TIGR04211 family SH3 domain-containing protein [Pseudoalteromonas sp. NZS127_1]MBG9998068.1 TIGR04211 family SH3 domain-containing protein [Pseudoalteromonas sp. NSLLW24]MBH0013705.1 TIGR04211 family SH3 domain-containing protein [Pseudoalteromonas sp. NZS100_1]MBH0016649.1 TIGR04211 family SH3 domain-containing protein [Pseudoalteromonas sp. NGC95]MBH0028080.1 TIGR04211 family SH3 domain-containing